MEFGSRDPKKLSPPKPAPEARGESLESKEVGPRVGTSATFEAYALKKRWDQMKRKLIQLRGRPIFRKTRAELAAHHSAIAMVEDEIADVDRQLHSV